VFGDAETARADGGGDGRDSRGRAAASPRPGLDRPTFDLAEARTRARASSLLADAGDTFVPGRDLTAWRAGLLDPISIARAPLRRHVRCYQATTHEYLSDQPAAVRRAPNVTRIVVEGRHGARMARADGRAARSDYVCAWSGARA
jgi:hypothetical protein